MNKVVELFGVCSQRSDIDWLQIVNEQKCSYSDKKCYKIRKSDPSVSIGTCTVLYGKNPAPVIICPVRLIERRQIFIDCLHLLTTHEPGNELHIVPEVSIPGGSVDYFLVSVRDGKVRDFVGIELQTLDTTGTVWPERQRLLRDLNIPRADNGEASDKPFGMNWKMTAKTILVQMHHKVHTFEHVNKKLVLVVQDKLLDYMSQEFSFGHLSTTASVGEPMHIHSYEMKEQPDKSFKLALSSRLSTDTDGIATCLGLQAEAKIELAQIVALLESKISDLTLFSIV